jgi:hypothetical protein
MLTGHHWGAGDGRSAWIYLGIAVRMVEMLDLCHEQPKQPDAPSAEEFVAAEEGRRTAWTCFLMENLLSGGGSRRRILRAEDMMIQLPCETEQFVFGIPVSCERLDDSFPPSTSSSTFSTGSLSMLGYTIKVAKLWGDVAQWACSSSPSEDEPWDSTSKFQNLSAALDEWKFKLPERFKYSIYSLDAHHSLGHYQGFCYMHCIYFMSLMFLYRTYLPHLDLAKRQESHATSVARSFHDSYRERPEWQGYANSRLYTVTSMVCDMCAEINKFGVDSRRGLVPWIGFTVYTAIGVMLYIYNFSTDFDSVSLGRINEQISAACKLLTEMKTSWPMAGRWVRKTPNTSGPPTCNQHSADQQTQFEQLQLMQKFYLSLSRNNDISPVERKTIRDALVDYGALHHSPVAQVALPAKREVSNNVRLFQFCMHLNAT